MRAGGEGNGFLPRLHQHRIHRFCYPTENNHPAAMMKTSLFVSRFFSSLFPFFLSVPIFPCSSRKISRRLIDCFSQQPLKLISNQPIFCILFEKLICLALISLKTFCKYFLLKLFLRNFCKFI